MLRKIMKFIVFIGIDGWEDIKTTHWTSAVHTILISSAIKIVSENIWSIGYM